MQQNANAQEDRATKVVPEIRVDQTPWRVASVTSLDGLRLRVRFHDGLEGEVDMSTFVRSERAGVFAVLRDENLFRQARAEMGAVTWPQGLDLAPDRMHAEISAKGKWVL